MYNFKSHKISGTIYYKDKSLLEVKVKIVQILYEYIKLHYFDEVKGTSLKLYKSLSHSFF